MVVFKILNKVTGQHYVGSCRDDIYERWELYVRAAEAGLDFPLYEEIRAVGEDQFVITELDYAENRDELKEIELFHTIELAARSLRAYKFGIKDSVIKRCTVSELDQAWMKDLSQQLLEERANKAPQTAAKAVAAAAATESGPAGSLPRPDSSAEPAAVTLKRQCRQPPPRESQQAPPRESHQAPAQTPLKGQPQGRERPADGASNRAVEQPLATQAPCQAERPIEPVRGTVVAQPSAIQPPRAVEARKQPQPAESHQELEKAVLADGINLLVKTLASAEQLGRGQQQAHAQAQRASKALADAERALQDLQGQQQQAAEQRQRLAQAVAASQAANEMLSQAQQRARAYSASALLALEQSQQTRTEVDHLQQQLTALLGRLKQGSGKSPAVTAVPDAAKRRVEAAGADTQPDPSLLELQRRQQQIIAAEQAKMVNQLKQLKQLLPQQQAAETSAAASTRQAQRRDGAVDSDPSAVVAAPGSQPERLARAWVAPVDGSQAQAQLLEKDADSATVVRHRSKLSKPVRQRRVPADGARLANSSPPAATERRLSGRKILGIRNR